MSSGVEFEQGRLYVDLRQSVLFFARVGELRLRCYVTRDVLVGHFGARPEVANAYKYCLRAYDRNVELIHAAAERLISAKHYASDGAVIVGPAAIGEQLVPAV